MATETTSYIKKKKQGDSLFEKLHQEGLGLLQMLSGDVWTDYNEHDPGVTILENIAYTLTELDYKANLPIKDLLIQKEGARLKSGDNGLFIASEILTTSPITIMDYRKLFYDKISNVKNVWIEPLGNQDDLSNLKGLYNIYVEMYSYNYTGQDLVKEQERIKREIRTVYNSNRNFCQDLHDIVVLKPLPLQLKFEILLLNNSDAEAVLANIFYETLAIVTNQINYYSLDELQKQGFEIDEIYDGPYLEYGFIKDSDLKERSNKIVFEEIIKVISKINGIARINSFSLIPVENENNPDTVFTDYYITFSSAYSPSLSFPVNIDHLKFFYDSIPFKTDLKETSNKLADKQADDYNRFRTVSQQMNEIEIPSGEYPHVELYLPVRNQFPITYGIGAFDLPEKVLSPQRYAQAKQLKAFLFPFDQIMANYLKQLNSLYTLYSDGFDQDLDTKSYYSQKIQDMDTLSDLFEKGVDDNNKSWEDILEEINNQYDRNAIDRLNLIADNILARFGESFNTYSLQKINDICYGEESAYADFKINLLKWKRKLINRYGLISTNRAKAYDCIAYNDLDSAAVNESDDLHNRLSPALIHKITILMGIEKSAIRPLSTVIKNSGITIVERKQPHTFIQEDINLIFPETGTGIIEFENILLINQQVEDHRNSLFFPGNKHSLLKEVLRNGILRTNYTIKRDTDPDKDNWYILFKGTSGNHLMHVTATEKEAEEVIDKTMSYLWKLNKDSEGMFLLEHILLTPPYYENYFGFKIEISNHSGKSFVFKEAQRKPLAGRNEDEQFVRQNIRNKEKIRVDQNTTEKGLILELKNSSGVVMAVSDKSVAHQFELDQMKKDLYSCLYDSQETVILNTIFLSYYGDKSIDENFFSFRMSFILPNWPARFQADIFKNKLTNLIREQAPIHVLSDIHWWSIDQMTEFEDLYYTWIKLLTDETNTKDIIPYSYKLIQLLQQSKQNGEVSK